MLITGAGGFVGGWLARRLRRSGFDVEARDRELDVTDGRALAAEIDALRPEAVVHLAALSSVVDSHAQARCVYAVNYLGGRAVLESVAHHAPGARVLLVGSGQVYGAGPPAAPPYTERDPLCPSSPYARSKAAADLLAAVWAARGLDVVRVRPFNHTGRGQSEAFVASSFARQVAEIESGRRPPVLRVGNLDSVRDFLDVEDVVIAYERLLDRSVPAAAYNVARGAGVSVRELLEIMLRQSRVRPKIEVDPARVRAGDALVGNPARLERATGWRPRFTLAETLDRLLEFWRAQLREAP